MSIAVIKDRIREIMVQRPGITINHIAEEIGMNRKTVGKYIREIRAEWAKPEGKE